MKSTLLLLSICCLLTTCKLYAQQVNAGKILQPSDTTFTIPKTTVKKDSIAVNKKPTSIKLTTPHNPKTATLRSLAIPGWGQVYNKEYWKLPIVYGALGTAAGFYIYNNTWYKRTRDAYNIRANNDTAHFPDIHPRLEPLPASSLVVYRNSFRRDRDYSALWFFLLWGLNILDATVFAHLKAFDVSSDLSLNVQPVIKTNGNAGLSLVLGYKPPAKPRIFDVSR